jgi:hypothetical protein
VCIGQSQHFVQLVFAIRYPHQIESGIRNHIIVARDINRKADGRRSSAAHGTTIKELIHDEFGHGIMSAIDFSMDISREVDPKGDCIRVITSSKFFPYKTY